MQRCPERASVFSGEVSAGKQSCKVTSIVCFVSGVMRLTSKVFYSGVADESREWRVIAALLQGLKKSDHGLRRFLEVLHHPASYFHHRSYDDRYVLSSG